MSHSLLHVLFVLLLVSCTSAEDYDTTAFKLAPIASAAPQSDSFTLVNNISCNATVVKQIYEMYAKNQLVFQTCVIEGHYKIFPFSGVHPTHQQIQDMSSSLACRALFMSLLLGGIPECVVSNFPMRAAAETLLKIGVDMDNYPSASNVVPFTDRFLEMMHWRRDVNLAQAARLPSDSGSKLYAEYASNLLKITTSGLFRLTPNKEIQYRFTIDDAFSQEQIIEMPSVLELQGSGSGIKVVAVSTMEALAGSSSLPFDVAATDVEPKAISKENLFGPELEISDAKAAAPRSVAGAFFSLALFVLM